MEFAKKLLIKYGWEDGKGLGKNNNGILQPLKASLKFDNTGFGADQAASDFNNHWWSRAFNEAAQNVEVKKSEHGRVSMKLKDSNASVEITTKSYSSRKLKQAKEKEGNAKYNNFLQSGKLNNKGYMEDDLNCIQDSEISIAPYKPLTDEELFKACDGRTAHKGARHGLKLSGKLLRIQQQEQELLARMMNSTSNTTQINSQVDKDIIKKSENKHKELAESQNEAEQKPLKKKRHKKSKQSMEVDPEITKSSNQHSKSKKDQSENNIINCSSDKRKNEAESSEIDDNCLVETIVKPKKNKSKRKVLERDEAEQVEPNNKKKKKSKRSKEE